MGTRVSLIRRKEGFFSSSSSTFTHEDTLVLSRSFEQRARIATLACCYCRGRLQLVVNEHIFFFFLLVPLFFLFYAVALVKIAPSDARIPGI